MPVSYKVVASYAAGAEPYSVATADLAGNGLPDIVVTDLRGKVDILMNQGNGSFAPAVSYAAGTEPTSVTIADLGNGRPDIVVADYEGARVEVLMNQGGDVFAPAVSYAVGPNPFSVATADLGNGLQDIVVATESGGVKILMNQGNGVFAAPVSYAAGLDPLFVTTADLGNGLQDIVVTNGNGGIDVLMNQGHGVFAAPVSYAAGPNSFSVTTADLGNGLQDIVVAGQSGGVEILMNQGHGVFAAPVSYAAGSSPYSVTTADLGNGLQDIIVANFSGGVDVLMNQGDGVFAAPVSYAAGSELTSVTTAHLNGSLPAIIVAGVDGYVRILEAIPTIVAATPAVVEQGQITLLGTASPAQSGDPLTLTQSAGGGIVSFGTPQADGTRPVIYTAPAGIAASGTDTVSYIVTDTTENSSASSGSQTVTLDAGPTIAAAVPSIVEHGQVALLGTVSPGETDDVLTLTQTAGAPGRVSLTSVLPDGTQWVIYTAPASIAASFTDSVGYSITDQHHGVVVGNSATVTLDAGPTIAVATPVVVEQGQVTVLGTVTPGEIGDTLSLNQVSGIPGTVSLGVPTDGAQQILYTAPPSIAASLTDSVGYSITDQHGAAVAGATATVTLDAGPTIVGATPVVVEQGQVTVLGTVRPGESGDVLTLAQTSGIPGTVSLGVPTDGAQQILYTAPASIAASGADSVGYSITDQHHDVVAGNTATVTLDAGPAITAMTTSGAVEDGQTLVLGTVSPGESGDTLTLTQLTGTTGTVMLGAVRSDGTQQILYTAPTDLAASSVDAVSYVIDDQHGVLGSGPTYPVSGSLTGGDASVTLDAGPTLALAAPAVVEQGQTTVLGTMTPGVSGDTLTLTQTSGSLGTVALGAMRPDGTQQVIYTAPASIAASGTDTVSYGVTDQHHDVMAGSSATVILDAGASIVAALPGIVEDGQFTVVGTVSPGESGDVLTLTQTGGGLGTLSLGAMLPGGTQQVLYTAPPHVTASGDDTVGYSIADQHGAAVASATATVNLDAGPTLVTATPVMVEPGQATMLGTVSPGEDGDVLTVTLAAGARGTVLLGTVQDDGTQQLLYIAPAGITVSGIDAVVYSVTDQHGAAVASGTASVTLDAGPALVVAMPAVVERGQATVLGTVSPGESGDTLVLTQSAGALGTVTLGAPQDDGSRQVIYTAPAHVLLSGTDTVAYSVADQHGDALAGATATITLDAGPALVAATPAAIEQGQATVLGTVSPGESGDTLLLTQAAGALGTVALGTAQADGSRQVIYTAPARVTLSGVDAVGYSIVDQHGVVVAGATAAVGLDAGPAIVAATPGAVEQDQATVLGTVSPGASGDTLTLVQSPGTLGAVSLGEVQADGSRQVVYTAPASVPLSRIDTAGYSVTDQHGAVAATATTAVTLDAGPTITTATPGILEQGQTTLLGTVLPGLAGDTLSLTQTVGNAGGTVSLLLVDGIEQVLYTAPSAVAANAIDTVGYSVVDQHGAVIASRIAAVSLDMGAAIVPAGDAVLEPGQTAVLGTVTPGLADDALTLRQTGAALGTIALGAVQPDGTQQVIYTAPASIAASGTDSVGYSVTDQHGAVVATAGASVTLDAGPAIAAAAPATVEQGQTIMLGTVTPGQAGDTLTLRQAAGALGTVSLGAVQADGTQQILYAAPASISESGADSVQYSVTDQYGAAVASQTAAVTLAITPFSRLIVDEGKSTLPITVTVALQPAVAGRFSSLGIGSLGADGATYSVTGDAAAVNAALHAVGFASAEAGASAPVLRATLTLDGGAATLFDSGSDDQIIVNGRGLELVGGGPGAVVTASSVGGDILVAAAGRETLDGAAASSGDVFFGNTSGSTVFVGGSGRDTIVGGGGANTVTSGSGGSVVFLGSGANLIQSHGADTVIGSGGNDTIQAGSAAMTFFTGGGAVDFTGGSAPSTVVGGSGSVTVSGGSGGGAFFGGAAGHNLLQSGSGRAVLVAGGDGDQLIATGSEDILVAGSGNETLSAAGSAGYDIVFGGSGADVVSLGGGTGIFLAGSGSASVSAGTGTALFDFVSGAAGQVSISGFDPGKDALALFGYGGGEAAHALQTASVVGGNTTLSLTDGTHITLLDVTAVTPGFIV